ncbi:hypothetical protein N7516_009441 [Penicillium verrucosum]|uniref:uncharacterized protein n=1 Tax=Penicillium verrucosum TaxID=60171 RepID=UPI00254571BB|nr:uncharacterized protein N7516_009441 [Penicillium verrucosum]KAJ5927668.1 hypothetical protein N7516_009441 [Penicillium verrucosum]
MESLKKRKKGEAGEFPKSKKEKKRLKRSIQGLSEKMEASGLELHPSIVDYGKLSTVEDRIDCDSEDPQNKESETGGKPWRG